MLKLAKLTTAQLYQKVGSGSIQKRHEEKLIKTSSDYILYLMKNRKLTAKQVARYLAEFNSSGIRIVESSLE